MFVPLFEWLDLLEPRQGCWGCGCPCVLSPAALLNKESFALLFLLHPDTFLLMLFLLLTCFSHSRSSNIEFWGELGSLHHKKSRENIVGWKSS